MSWADLHKASEEAAIKAEQAFRKGNIPIAAQLYSTAAEFEQKALETLESTKARTRGITTVSAVSLWYKAGVYDHAEQLAHAALADPLLPAFAKTDLRHLVQAIWTENSKRAANVRFLAGQVFVSVKGGEVISGGAPLDLVVEKVQTIQAMFYRTVEFIKDMPLRRRGGPAREIQEMCRPWLFQAAPGSYQFSVAIQEAKQFDLFEQDVRPDLVAHQFLEILRATATDDTKYFEDLVPKEDYRNAFLKLSRNLAPTGKAFDSIELRAATNEHSVALTPEARLAINQALRKTRPAPAGELADTEEQIVGTLRAVDLERDFLNIITSDEILHIVGLGDAMDDVIGPMVNKTVRVQIVRTAKAIRFRDIELDE